VIWNFYRQVRSGLRRVLQFKPVGSSIKLLEPTLRVQQAQPGRNVRESLLWETKSIIQDIQNQAATMPVSLDLDRACALARSESMPDGILR